MVIDAKASFGRAKQIYGRERFSRPRPETIERKLRRLSGLHVHQKIVVFLLGRLAFPVEVLRVALGHLEARAARKDGILFRATATENEVFHAVYLIEFGSVNVPVEDNYVEILSVGGQNLVGILRLGDGTHSGAAKRRGMVGDEDLFGARSLGFIQPLLHLLHLCFVSGSVGIPRRGRAVIVFAGPQKDEASAVEIELVDESLVRDAELIQIGKCRE